MNGRHRAVAQATAPTAGGAVVGRSFFDLVRESISDPDVIAAADKTERDMRAAPAQPSPVPGRPTTA